MTLSQMALGQYTIYHVKAGITMAIGDKIADFAVDNYAALKLKHPQRETCSLPDPTTSLIVVMGLLFRDGNDLNLRQLEISDAVLLVCRCRVRDTSSLTWANKGGRKECRSFRLMPFRLKI